MSTHVFPALSLLLVVLSFVTTTDAESLSREAWPQWRGPQRTGAIEPTQWPANLTDSHLSVRWSVPQGPSYSGPIVAADRIFVTETKNKKFEVVRALNRANGETIWETQWTGAMRVPFFAAANGSWIRATPAFDGERLYVAGMKDVLVCLHATTGEFLWKRDFVKETGSKNPAFGFVSSPLVVGDHVYVQAGACFAKLDKFTGKTVWRALEDGGGTYGSAFSSPTFATIAGVPQLVVQTRSTIAGVHPDSGDVLWSAEIEAFRGMNILTPTVIGDSVFTSSYGGRSQLLTITRAGGSWSVSRSWTHKSQGYMSTPVVIDGHIYLHLRNRRFVCLDVATGAEQWTTRPFGKYWSMVANGDRILALDQRGELLLIRANPQAFELVGRRKVADDSWAHLAVVGDEILVRDLAAMKVLTWR